MRQYVARPRRECKNQLIIDAGYNQCTASVTSVASAISVSDVSNICDISNISDISIINEISDVPDMWGTSDVLLS